MTKQGEFKNCERCHKAFYEWPYLSGKRRFCSKSCSNKSTGNQQRKTKLAKADPLNPRRYTSAYYEWRNKCLARDNLTCRNCNKIMEAKFAVVHHPRSWRGYPKLRYDISNGITLCRSCHNLTHILPSRKANSGF